RRRADPGAACIAEHDLPGRGSGHRGGRHRDSHCGRAQLSGAWGPAADPGVGGDAQPGARLPPQRLVDGDLPGPCDHAGGHQPEPLRRLAARSARPAAAHVNPPAVVQDIERLAGRFSGVLGVWSHSLTSGEMVEWNAQDVFPAASANTLPILHEVYQQAGEERFRLTDTRTVAAADVVPGSGVLKDLTTG